MLSLLAYFFGAVFAVNAVPHFVAGVQGRLFPSPFAKPPGVGMSRPMVNVAWGSTNAVIAWALLAPTGFDPGRLIDAVTFMIGAVLMALFLAWHFGRVMAERDPG